MQSQLAHDDRGPLPMFDLLVGRCSCPEFLVAFPGPVTGECIQCLRGAGSLRGPGTSTHVGAGIC